MKNLYSFSSTLLTGVLLLSVQSLAYAVGENCTTSIQAQEGTNLIPATELTAYWYSFTMPREGKLVIDREDYGYVGVYPQNCNQEEIIEYNYSGDLTVTGLAVGETIKLKFSPEGGGANWNLSVLDYVVGDVCSIPLPVQLGMNSVTDGSRTEVWSKVIAAEDGKIILKPDTHLLYDVFKNSCDQLIKVDAGYGSQVQIEDVIKGQEYLIKWHTEYTDSFSFQYSSSAYEIGEKCSLPASALEGENIVPVTEMNQYWYEFTMPKDGTLLISSSLPKQVRVSSGYCDNLFYKKGGYEQLALAGLKAGEHLYIYWDAQGGDFSWNLSLQESEAGDNCDSAVKANEGENLLTANAVGDEWFVFAMPRDGKIEIQTDASLLVEAYTGTCRFKTKKGEGVGKLGLTDLKKGEQIFLRWNLREGSVGWQLMVTDPVQGDQCGTPFLAKEGENIFPESANHQDLWYSFTMPQKGKVLISFEDDTYQASLSVYSGVCSEKKHLNSSNSHRVAVTSLEAGDKLRIRWQKGYPAMKFTIVVKDDSEGDACNKPVIAPLGTIHVPEKEIQYVWYRYTADRDGRLVIRPSYPEVHYYVYKGECENPTLSYGSSGTTELGGLQQGEDVLLSFFHYNQAFDLELSMVEDVQGSACDLPFEAVEGTQITPRTKYPTWYKFIPAVDGKIEIESTGYESVTVYRNNCDSLVRIQSGQRALTVHKVVAGEPLFISWGPGDYAFEWKISNKPSEAGDVCQNTLPAELGTNYLKPTGNTYVWYKYIMPFNGTLVAESDRNNDVWMYRGCTSEEKIQGTYGRNSVSGLREGEEILIAWRVYSGSFDWDLKAIEEAPGHVCKGAVQAVEGVNTLPILENQYYWYGFTMPKDGKLGVETNSYAYATFYTNTCDSLVQGKQGYRSVSQAGFNAGDQVLIRWEPLDGSFDWNLTVSDYEPGNICTQAIPADSGVNYSAQQPNWYSYTMKNGGNLIVSSVNSAFYDTDLKVYFTCEGALGADNDDFASGFTSQLTLNALTAGQTVYIHWDDTHSTADFQWNIQEVTTESQTINFGEISSQLLSGKGIKLRGESSSGLPVRYEVSGPATLDGDSLIFNSAEYVEVTAIQDGNASYQPAPPVYRSFCVIQAFPEISLFGESYVGVKLKANVAQGIQWYLNGEKIQDATTQEFVTSSEGMYSFEVLDATCGMHSDSIEVKKKAQEIKDALVLPEEIQLSEEIVLNFETSSDLPVTVEVEGPATMLEGVLIISGYGQVTITVTQEGNEFYSAAEPLVYSFCVYPPAPSILVSRNYEAALGVILSSDLEGPHQWYLNGIVIEGATTSSWEAKEEGTYSVEANPDGCAGPVSEAVEITNTTGVSAANADILFAYPNPTSSEVRLVLQPSTNGDKLRVQLISAAGGLHQPAFRLVTQSGAEKIIEIDLSYLPSGLHRILIDDGENHFQANVIKL